MLQWTAGGTGPRFIGIVHHTDALREWAYDRKSSIGRLDKALDDAKTRGWTVGSGTHLRCFRNVSPNSEDGRHASRASVRCVGCC